jgi:hypothetical protein
MSSRSNRSIALVFLAAVCACYAGAQGTSDYDTQLQQGAAQLQAGDANQALSSADAAIRMAPDRWDGFALAGRALLSLMHYEEAADALSKAIELAPPAQQSALRALRRSSLVQESGAGAAPAVQTPAAPAAPVAPATVEAAPAPPAPALAPTPAPAPQRTAATAAVRVKSRRQGGKFRSRSDDPVWIDASGGLMWARPWEYPAGVRGPWDFHGAQSFCSALRLGGYSDWRLPSVAEAQGVYLVSSKRWAWSSPEFDVDYGLNAALRDRSWTLPPITANGDTFNGDRLLVWTSTPGEVSGEHAAIYFGTSYSVKDDSKVGVSLGRGSRRNPFQGYALCVRSGE